MIAFGLDDRQLHADSSLSLLRWIASAITDGDRFLLEVDLVKDEATMIEAYDDPYGVSAEFNRNDLKVVNRELDRGHTPVEAFEHMVRC